MAGKKPNKTVVAALNEINKTGRATAEIGKPLVDQGFIEVNTGDVVDGKAAARLTAAGLEAIGASGGAAATAATPSAFALIDGVVLPESKRGFGRTAGPSKYPFATMNVGQSFFVPASADMENPVKTLGSTVSNANNKFRTATGEKKNVTRTKRGEGNKAVLNADGSKVKETVEVPVYKQDKKFTIRGVKAGSVYGSFTAPADGAIIARTA